MQRKSATTTCGTFAPSSPATAVPSFVPGFVLVWSLFGPFVVILEVPLDAMLPAMLTTAAILTTAVLIVTMLAAASMLSTVSMVTSMPASMKAAVVLLGFISTTPCVFRLPESPPGLPPAYLTNKPPLLFTDENDKCQAEPDPPPSVADHFIAWQLRTSTSAAALQKPPSPGC
ncbi:hypothetical protein MRX96_051744, partial [Rhipicephalus microplus]